MLYTGYASESIKTAIFSLHPESLLPVVFLGAVFLAVFMKEMREIRYVGYLPAWNRRNDAAALSVADIDDDPVRGK